MILKTQIRPDRFGRIVSGKKKEHRIPFDQIDLIEKRYEVVIFTTSFSRTALVELLDIKKDEKAGEYVLTLGSLKTRNKSEVNSAYEGFISATDKKYTHTCEILRDGQKVGTLNLSTKQGRKQKAQLSRLQGYTFRNLPPELITH